jgi:hypothetical protein
MAISARIVGWPLEATGGAEVKMPAQRSRPARDEITHDGLLARGQGVELAIFVEVAAKDVSHPERRSRQHHARRASGVVRHSRMGSAQDASCRSAEQVDGTRGGAQMDLAQVQVGGGGLDARMTQQNLHTANVGASFEHVGGEAMAIELSRFAAGGDERRPM